MGFPAKRSNHGCRLEESCCAAGRQTERQSAFTQTPGLWRGSSHQEDAGMLVTETIFPVQEPWRTELRHRIKQPAFLHRTPGFNGAALEFITSNVDSSFALNHLKHVGNNVLVVVLGNRMSCIHVCGRGARTEPRNQRLRNLGLNAAVSGCRKSSPASRPWRAFSAAMIAGLSAPC